MRLGISQGLCVRVKRGVRVLNLHWDRLSPLYVRHGAFPQRGAAMGQHIANAGTLSQEIVIREEVMEQGRTVPHHAHELGHWRGLQ
jgi:hypothetical protein